MVFERNGTFSYLPNLNEHSTDLEMVTGASLNMMAQLSMLKIAQPRVEAKWTNGMASISPSPRETIAAANVPYRAETNSALPRSFGPSLSPSRRNSQPSMQTEVMD